MAKRIVKYGHRLKRITTIGDDVIEIASTLNDILKKNPDIVVVSGGLIMG